MHQMVTSYIIWTYWTFFVCLSFRVKYWTNIWALIMIHTIAIKLLSYLDEFKFCTHFCYYRFSNECKTVTEAKHIPILSTLVFRNILFFTRFHKYLWPYDIVMQKKIWFYFIRHRPFEIAKLTGLYQWWKCIRTLTS